MRFLLRLTARHWKRIVPAALVIAVLEGAASWVIIRCSPRVPGSPGVPNALARSRPAHCRTRSRHFAEPTTRIRTIGSIRVCPKGPTHAGWWWTTSRVRHLGEASCTSLEVPESGLDPERSFPLALLSEWAGTLHGLDLVLVLGGYVDDALAEDVRAVLDPVIAVRVDADGALFSSAVLERGTGGFGFLIGPDGTILIRQSGLRVTSATPILVTLQTYAREDVLPDPASAFSMVHPLRVAQSPLDLELTYAEGGADVIEPLMPGRPTLVYRFSAGCPPCRLCSEVTSTLAAEYSGRVNVVGLSYSLTDSTVAAAAEIGRAHLSLFSEERQAAILELPATPEGRQLYAERRAEDLAASMQALPAAFPVAWDRDGRHSGALGLGDAPLPSWGLYDAGGNLVDVIPGANDTVYQNGEPLSTCYPTLSMLRARLDEALRPPESTQP